MKTNNDVISAFKKSYLTQPKYFSPLTDCDRETLDTISTYLVDMINEKVKATNPINSEFIFCHCPRSYFLVKSYNEEIKPLDVPYDMDKVNVKKIEIKFSEYATHSLIIVLDIVICDTTDEMHMSWKDIFDFKICIDPELVSTHYKGFEIIDDAIDTMINDAIDAGIIKVSNDTDACDNSPNDEQEIELSRIYNEIDRLVEKYPDLRINLEVN